MEQTVSTKLRTLKPGTDGCKDHEEAVEIARHNTLALDLIEERRRDVEGKKLRMMKLGQEYETDLTII